MEQICSKCGFSNPPNLSYCSKCQTILGKLSKGSLIAKRYKILELLGKGNMGFVFKAFDIHLDRYVALKSISLKDIISTDQRERTRKRILREAKAQAKLGDHPNIVIVYDFGLEEDFYYIIMELIVGYDIEYYIKNKIVFPIPQTLKIISDICLALDYAHQNNIIHRDIKPSNIIITHNKVTKIADFGIAKILDSEETNITKTGMLVGTPYYMSPEQILGKTLDGRSDIFSLGSILYKMLTLKNPFEGKGVIQILDSIVTKAFPDPQSINHEIPEAVARIIRKSLEKDRLKRYQSSIEMHRDISSYLSSASPMPLSESSLAEDKTPEIKTHDQDTVRPVSPRKEDIQEPRTIEVTTTTPFKPGHYSRLVMFIFAVMSLLIIITGFYIFSKYRSRETDTAKTEVTAGEKTETDTIPVTGETDSTDETTIIPDSDADTDTSSPEDTVDTATGENLPDETGARKEQEEIIIQARLNNADKLINSKNFDEARQEINSILLLEPGNKEALQLLKKIDTLLESEKEPEKDLPEHASPGYDELAALFAGKNYRAVIDIYEKDSSMLSKSPDPEENAQLRLMVGSSYRNTGDIIRSHEILKDAMEIDCSDITLLNLAVEIASLYSISNDFRSQVNTYINAQEKMKSISFKKQATDKAYDVFSFLGETDKAASVQVLDDIADTYADIGDNSGLFRSKFEAGILYYNKKSYDQAIDALKRAVSVSENITANEQVKRNAAVAYYHLGLCYNAVQENHSSIRAFEESLRYFQENEPDSELYGKILINLSKLVPRHETRKKTDYLDDAMGFYAKSREWEQYASLAVDLAEITYRTDPQKSYNLLNGIQISQIKDNDTKGKIHYYIALSLIRLNKENDAIDNFKNANRFFTQSKNHFLLGMVAYESSMLFYNRKDFSKSLKEISTARENFTAGGNSYYLCYAIYQESLIHIELKDRSLAKEKVREGISLAESILRTSADSSQKERLGELLQKFKTLEKNYLF